MRKALLWLGILGLLFGIGWTAHRFGGGSSEPSPSVSNAEKAPTDNALENLYQARLAALQSENRRLRTQLAALQTSPMAAAPAVEEVPSVKPLVEKKTELSFEEEYRQTIEMEARIAERFNDLLATEPYDEEWAAETETQVKQTVNEIAMVGAQLMDTACRTTFCRAVLAFDSEENKDTFLAKATLKAPFNTVGWIHSEGLEDQEIELFFSRKGNNLPDVGDVDRD